MRILLNDPEGRALSDVALRGVDGGEPVLVHRHALPTLRVLCVCVCKCAVCL